MRAFVAFVICVVAAVPPAASATSDTGRLLRTAGRLSGLQVRTDVRTSTVSSRRYDSLLLRAVERQYPRSLQTTDARLYERLGLNTHNIRALGTGAQTSRAWYDPGARKLFLRRTPAPGRASVVHELGRALVDQNFGLRRLLRLRPRDRDRALAAFAIVDGTAALASKLRPRPLQGTPLDRFVQLDSEAGVGPGRALATQLRYLGGRAALASALRTFPQTTEQLLHVDKFLERERALPIALPTRIGAARLGRAQTFGELEVGNLLRAFGVAKASDVAAGWGGGRIALYLNGTGDAVAVIVLRWDEPEDAAEWRAAVAGYVHAAFPGSVRRDCPPLDGCWGTEVAAGTLGNLSVLAGGPGSTAIATALLRD